MRKDVNKILTECYKEGRGRAHPFPRRFVEQLFDEVGGKIGMHNLHEHKSGGYGTKSFGENLSYLPRFLAKNVGRKWDDIYSEICATFDRRSAVNAHIFQHLFDYFIEAKEIKVIDGELFARSNYRFGFTPISEANGFFGNMYVDPRDGILKLNKDWKSYNQVQAEREAEQKARRERKFKELPGLRELHKIDGIWYLFTIKPIPEPKVTYRMGETCIPVYYMNVTERQEHQQRKKDFKKLSEEQKKEVGVKVVIHHPIPDIYRCISEGLRSALTKEGRRKVKHRHYEDVRPTHYYAEKKTASYEELRAAGLRV